MSSKKRNNDEKINSNNDTFLSKYSGLGKLSDQVINKSRTKILDILINEYHLDEKDAIPIQKSIDVSTRANMREKYSQKEYFLDFDRFGKTNSACPELMNMFPDYANWSWTALNVPFYQSLGDTIGYYNGNWEFNYGDVRAGPDAVNEFIYEFISLGGVNDLSITNWKASDDTILYIATMEVLSDPIIDINDFGNKVKNAYIKAKPLIADRHPGQTTNDALEMQQTIEWDKLPYNSRAIGNGSAMRSGCIGIFYPGSHNRKKLISLAVESSRITHNSAIAILGSVVAALFTAFALEKIPIQKWPFKLLKILRSNLIDTYIETSRPKDYPLYIRDKIIFVGQWDKYITWRFSGVNPKLDIKFMKNPVQRYKYLSEKFSKGCDIPGACADDALIMAYDALLQSEGVFEKIIVYGILHPGDSDTVGSIALSWFGAFYHSARNERLIGYRFEELEFHDQLYDLMEKNMKRMVNVFYYDIYINIAMKYLKQHLKKK